MPRYAPNKVPPGVKRRYFERIRTGMSGSEAAKAVGVSLSCGSLWFIDAGSVRFIDTPISSRYLTQVGLTPDGGHLTGGTAGPTGRMSVCRASGRSTPRSFGSRRPAW